MFAPHNSLLKLLELFYLSQLGSTPTTKATWTCKCQSVNKVKMKVKVMRKKELQVLKDDFKLVQK